MMQQQAKRFHFGFSLIEAAIVLAVVGMVIGGIWVAASAINQKRNLDNLVRTISFTYDKLHTLYRSVDVTSVQLVSGSLLLSVAPAGSVDSSGVGLVDDWGNTINVYVAPDGIQFYFPDQYGPTPGLPSNYCEIVAPKLGQVFRNAGMGYINGAGGLGGNVIGADTGSDLSTLSDAVIGCPFEFAFYLYLDY